VENTEVYLGNSALIKCAIPEYVRPYVRVASWHRGEEILLPDLSDVGECCHILTGEGVYRQLKFMCPRFGFLLLLANSNGTAFFAAATTMAYDIYWRMLRIRSGCRGSEL